MTYQTMQLTPDLKHSLSRAEKIQLIELLAEKERRRKTSLLGSYKPYPKQQEFHELGATASERCLMAGNQLGKTLAGAMEAAMHATGKYPNWWKGKRFNRANVGWVCGVTGEVIRDTTQRLLIGRIETDSIGEGTIPKDCILHVQKAIGTPNLLDHVRVRHVDGDVSLIFFKSYANGRPKFQGETIQWIWYDEEPPADIYSEGLTRTNDSGQFSMLTYTPLLGMSDVTAMFLTDPSPHQVVVNMTIDDVEHYTEEEKQQIINSYPEHEREARAKGIPILGSGRIYPVAEEKITIDPIEIPSHWAQINGLDFGWDHPQACVNLAWDRDADIVYVTRAYRARETTPETASITIRSWGKWIPTAWPHDGYQHDKGSGQQLAEQYREAGLNMLNDHATHAEGGNGVEAGLMEILDRMRTGRFKVFSTLADWFEEFRMYHRKDGKVVKERDDLMSGTRYAVMMLRKAEVYDDSWGQPLIADVDII